MKEPKKTPIDIDPDISTQGYRSAGDARGFGTERTVRGVWDEIETLVVFSVPALICTTGLAVLITYIFAIHGSTIDGLTIQTTASISYFTTISQAISTVVVRTAPIGVTLYAYQLANEWLEASKTHSENRPSPLQLGLLTSILRNGSVLTFVQICLHFFGFTDVSKRQKVRVSPLLTKAATVFGVLFGLSFIIPALDTWLHLSSIPLTPIVELPVIPSDSTQFGRQFNQSRCDFYAGETSIILGDNPSLASLCGINVGEVYSSMATLPKALQTFSNTSLIDRVAFTDDQHAIMVSVLSDPKYMYNASTLGVQASCESITHRCLGSQPMMQNGAPVFDCTGSPPLVINNTLVQSQVNPFGIVNSSGQISVPFVNDTASAFAAQSNPFQVAAVVSSAAYGNSSNTPGSYVGDTGFFYDGAWSWNVITCNVFVRNVQYHYEGTFSLSELDVSSGGTYQTLNTSDATQQIVMLFGALLGMGSIGFILPQRIEGAGLDTGNYSRAFALELSSELSASSAALLEPARVASISSIRQAQESKINLLPLTLFCLAVLFYCYKIGAIAIQSAILYRSRPFVKQVHMRLTSSLPMINLLFGPVDPRRTESEHELELFQPESEYDRLNLGAIDTEDGTLFGFSGMRMAAVVQHQNSYIAQDEANDGAEPDENSETASLASTSTVPRLLPRRTSSSVVTVADLEAKLERAPSLGGGPAPAASDVTISAHYISLLTSGIVVCTVGPVLAVPLYLFVIHNWRTNGLGINITAQLGHVLGLSQALCQIVTLSMPIVMTLYAYRLAAEWLKASREEGSRERPSPIQLGLLMTLLEGANLYSYFKVRFQVSTLKGTRGALSIPRILSRALHVLGLLLVLSGLTSAFDIWLHLSSTSVPLPRTSPYMAFITDFGRAINDTLCAEYDVSLACGLINRGGNQSIPGYPEGLRTLGNSSQVNRVAFTDDQHAIIVPASIPPSVMYTATTLGVKSSCQSITDLCVHPEDGVANWTQYAPAFNCTGTPLVNIDNTYVRQRNRIFGVLNGTGGTSGITDYAFDSVETNPFTMVALSKSNAFLQNLSAHNFFVGQTGFYIQGGEDLANNMLLCNVSVKNVQYVYTSSATTASTSSEEAFQTVSSVDATLEDTKVVASTMDLGIMAIYIPDRVEGAGLYSGSYPDAYALELSRELMAFSAWIYQPSQVMGIETYEQVLGTRLQIIPLILYLIVIFTFSIVTLIIGIISITAFYSRPFVDLGHKRIVSPLPLFYYLFGPVDPHRTWKSDHMDLFLTETESDRLSVGRVEFDGQQVFGVARELAVPEEPW